MKDLIIQYTFPISILIAVYLDINNMNGSLFLFIILIIGLLYSLQIYKKENFINFLKFISIFVFFSICATVLINFILEKVDFNYIFKFFVFMLALALSLKIVYDKGKS